jgi:hypothetical protein
VRISRGALPRARLSPQEAQNDSAMQIRASAGQTGYCPRYQGRTTLPRNGPIPQAPQSEPKRPQP